MVRIILVMCGILSFATVEARADSGTTRPSMKVAVVPFDVHGDTGRDWLGRAMQEGLATGLHQASGVIVAGVAPANAAGAMSMTKSTGADAVIFGSIQLVDEQIRVTGQIVSTDTGESLGTLRSDGSLRDLFDIEDTLAARVERILMPPPANRITTAGSAATLQVVGPTVGPGVPRYFDGNLMAQLTPPDRFRDQYDKYYYQPGNTCSYSAYCGASWGAWGCGLWSSCGVCCPVIATPVTGW
jgi:TolB-like protein